VSPDTLRRLTKLLWQRVLAVRCPWYASNPPDATSRAADWLRRQVVLTRELAAVACGDVAPSEDLLVRALNFLEGAQT
jgi:hypothetical protein